MASRLFKLAAAMSLFFLGATLCLWVRSADHYARVGYNGDVELEAADGGGSFLLTFIDRDPQTGITGLFATRETEFWGDHSLESGFAYAPTQRWMPKVWVGRTTPRRGTAASGGGDRVVLVFCGYWLPCLAFAVLPLRLVRARSSHATRRPRRTMHLRVRPSCHAAPLSGLRRRPGVAGYSGGRVTPLRRPPLTDARHPLPFKSDSTRSERLIRDELGNQIRAKECCADQHGECDVPQVHPPRCRPARASQITIKRRVVELGPPVVPHAVDCTALAKCTTTKKRRPSPSD